METVTEHADVNRSDRNTIVVNREGLMHFREHGNEDNSRNERTYENTFLYLGAVHFNIMLQFNN